MADQLRLFPSEDPPADQRSVLASEIGALDELFAGDKKYRENRTVIRMMTCISRFSQYSIFNGFLLFLQKPDATLVATPGAWWKRFGRRPKADATPMIILAPMAPVLFLFDHSDTEGPPVDADLLKPAAFRGRMLEEAYDKTVENCSIHGISVRFSKSSDSRTGEAVTLTYNTKKQYHDLAPDAGSNYLVVLDGNQPLENRFDALVHALGHIFSGHLGIDRNAWWQDRRGVEQWPAEIEAEAVSRLVLSRKRLTVISGKYLSGDTHQHLPAFSLSAVFNAAQYIEDMGKALWQFPRKKSRYL